MNKKNKNENEKKNQSIVDEEDYEYEKSIAEKNRELIRQHEEAMERAYERQKEKEEQERKERENRIKNDKLELLKLKEGIVEQEDSSMKEVEEEKIELHGKAKLANIWYHNKVWIMFGVLLVIFATIIVVSQVTKEKPDITVMMIANNGLSDRGEDVEKFLEKYTPDFDGNGYVHVSVIMCPISDKDQNTQSSPNYTKLIANLQLGEAVMVITDDKSSEQIADVLKDMTEDFPDNEHFDKLGYKLNTQKAKNELNYSNMPEDTRISMRKASETTGDSLEKMQKNYDKAFKVLENIAENLN